MIWSWSNTLLLFTAVTAAPTFIIIILLEKPILHIRSVRIDQTIHNDTNVNVAIDRYLRDEIDILKFFCRQSSHDLCHRGGSVDYICKHYSLLPLFSLTLFSWVFMRARPQHELAHCAQFIVFTWSHGGPSCPIWGKNNPLVWQARETNTPLRDWMHKPTWSKAGVVFLSCSILTKTTRGEKPVDQCH